MVSSNDGAPKKNPGDMFIDKDWDMIHESLCFAATWEKQFDRFVKGKPDLLKVWDSGWADEKHDAHYLIGMASTKGGYGSTCGAWRLVFEAVQFCMKYESDFAKFMTKRDGTSGLHYWTGNKQEILRKVRALFEDDATDLIKTYC